MRYLKSQDMWMSEDGTLYSADKKTVIGKATIINRFKPGPEVGTWVDSRGDLYAEDRRTLIKTAVELAKEKRRATIAARKEAERMERERMLKIFKEEAKARRAANRAGQRKINERKLDEAFGKNAST